MNKLNPATRYDPLTEGDLHEYLEELRFTPFQKQVPYFGPGWLHLSTLYVSIVPGAGPRGGWFHAKVTDALCELAQTRSIFDASPAHIHQSHNLELIERDDGKVYLFLGAKMVSGHYNLAGFAIDDVRAALGAAVAAYANGSQS